MASESDSISTAASRWSARNRIENLTVDRLTALLVGLVVFMNAAAIVLIPHLQAAMPTASSQSSSLSIGPSLAGIVIVESLLIVGLFRLWRRVPAWLRWAIRRGVLVLLLATLLGVAYAAGELVQVLLQLSGLGLFIVSWKLLERLQLEWLLFNAAAVALGVVITASASLAIAPVVVLLVLLLIMAWDHFAVNLSDIMGDLVTWSTGAGIPNYVILPKRLRVDTDALGEFITGERDEKPDSVAGVIGIGDFVFPALLSVSAWVAGVEAAALAAILGTTVAIVVLRDSLARADEGLPALPWLNTGAMVGFATGIVMFGVPVTTALGL